MVSAKGIAAGSPPPPPLVTSAISLLCVALNAWVFVTNGRNAAAMAVATFLILSLQLLVVRKPRFAQLTSSLFGLFYCGGWGWRCGGNLLWGGALPTVPSLRLFFRTGRALGTSPVSACLVTACHRLLPRGCRLLAILLDQAAPDGGPRCQQRRHCRCHPRRAGRAHPPDCWPAGRLCGGGLHHCRRHGGLLHWQVFWTHAGEAGGGWAVARLVRQLPAWLAHAVAWRQAARMHYRLGFTVRAGQPGAGRGGTDRAWRGQGGVVAQHCWPALPRWRS